jgi:hypothetical protein
VRLRLTRAALKDLGLPIEELRRLDASEYVDAHPVVAKFVELRAQSPTGQETTSLPATPATVWNLHCDRWRGLTWHDEGDGIVWLLGVGWHESGSRDDAYAVLKRRDELDQLLPTITDFEDAERDDIELFLEALQDSAPRILADAAANPGREIRGEVADCAFVAVLIERVDVDGTELRETWIGVEMPPHPSVDRPLPSEWLTYLLAALLPGAEVDALRWGGNFPRAGGSRVGEIVVSWST